MTRYLALGLEKNPVLFAIFLNRRQVDEPVLFASIDLILVYFAEID